MQLSDSSFSQQKIQYVPWKIRYKNLRSEKLTYIEFSNRLKKAIKTLKNLGHHKNDLFTKLKLTFARRSPNQTIFFKNIKTNLINTNTNTMSINTKLIMLDSNSNSTLFHILPQQLKTNSMEQSLPILLSTIQDHYYVFYSSSSFFFNLCVQLKNGTCPLPNRISTLFCKIKLPKICIPCTSRIHKIHCSTTFLSPSFQYRNSA